jgi:hypothetical protein
VRIVFTLAIALVAVGVLFLLTELAFGAEGRLGHPYRATAAVTALLVAGLALMFLE